MADNLYTYQNLPDIGLLRFSGPDAEVFAHSQFANDVLALAPGQWQWNCGLSAKGRVIEIFALVRLAEGELLALLPDGRATEWADHLKRFIFRRKVALTVETSPVSACLAAPDSAHGNTLARLDNGVIELDMGGTNLPRSLRIGLHVDGAPAITNAWRATDLQLGLPRLLVDQQDSWTAQQLGLDRLNAYSVRKGCYPGQEIVARTHFLGKAKRATVLLDSDEAQPGDAVEHDGLAIGQVACTAGNLSLAILPLESDIRALTLNGRPATALHIHEGLAR